MAFDHLQAPRFKTTVCVLLQLCIGQVLGVNENGSLNASFERPESVITSGELRDPHSARLARSNMIV
jgi:hypothetical protein